MSTDDNKTMIRRFVETCVNTGDTAALDTFVDMNVVFHSTRSAPTRGIEAIRQSFVWFHTVFPDLHIMFEDLVAEGDTVVGRWIARGTHKGTFQNLPPSGKQVSWTGIDIYQVVQGKIRTWWREQDALGMLQQLGAIPVAEKPTS